MCLHALKGIVCLLVLRIRAVRFKQILALILFSNDYKKSDNQNNAYLLAMYCYCEINYWHNVLVILPTHDCGK